VELVQRRSRRAARFIEVELRQVRLNLGGRPVLRGIDWHICPGQRWVLCGPNGSGKTQLLKLLAGDVWPSPVGGGTRSFRYGGESFTDPYGIKDEVAYLGPERQDRYEHYEWNHRVELIVATGLQRTDIPLALPAPADRRRIARLLAGLGIASLSRRRFLNLSYGERRLVLLARALAWRPKLLLLDELFNGLDPVNHARAARCLQRLSRSALPWVLSTHRAQDAPAAATHWCELEAGRITSQGRLRAGSSPWRARSAAPAALKAARPPATPRSPMPAPRPTSAPALITLRRARVWREGIPVLRDISLEIRRGDCWLVHGANGSGKSTLMQTLYGDLGVARGGTLLRAGIAPGVALQAFQRRVGLIAPELQAIYPRDLRAVEVVVSGLGASLGLNTAASALELRLARRALRRLGAVSLATRTVRTLSYGQLRRVLFARAIVHAPDILLLDEPYAGLDLRQRTALRGMVERLMSGGVTAVMATHHVDEWPRQATHELELGRGRVVYCGPVRSPAAPRIRRAS
jgi:molybdate transport system ATP-binding protein